MSYKFSPIVFLFLNTMVFSSFLINDAGIRWSHVTIVSIVLFVLLFPREIIKPKFSVQGMCLLIFAGAAFGAIWWGDTGLIMFSIWVALGFVIAISQKIDVLIGFVRVSTGFLLLLIIGAIYSFIDALSGNAPVFAWASDIRPDNIKYYFGGTFTNSYYLGTFIRPAGVYDEPGTFAFIISCMILIRDVLDRNRNVTRLLLFGGLITFSFAFIVFVILYLVLVERRIRLVIYSLIIMVFIAFLLSYSGYADPLLEGLLVRFSFNDDGHFIADTRSFRVANAIDLIVHSPEVLLWGVGPDCYFGTNYCNLSFSQFGDNPLGPLVEYGVFIAWPYYFVLVKCLLYVLKSKGSKAIAFLLFLLIVQRPMLFLYGFATLIYIVINQIDAREHSMKSNFLIPMSRKVRWINSVRQVHGKDNW